ncbi:DUF438 domain-containing protein [candidate division KSB1 bacterium]|nr:MAG: DUF438 domain-containing protein [candidate division KSB1 bacterium]
MPRLKLHFSNLAEADVHYRRVENLVFPYLEKLGITGPPAVMWGKHDEIRDLLKAVHEALSVGADTLQDDLEPLINFVIKPTTAAIEEMIYKEEKILFPMCVERLSEADWSEIYNSSPEIGFCLYEPQSEWRPQGSTMQQERRADAGAVELPSGSFSVEELMSVLNTLPIDITFVDKNDKVKYFSQGASRIFDRNRSILGRSVQMCHPPTSVHVVEQILNDFKSGKESRAPFWIQRDGKFIHIEYFAVRGENGDYLGTLEVSQDLTALRGLEGEQRLLSYGKKQES